MVDNVRDAHRARDYRDTGGFGLGWLIIAIVALAVIFGVYWAWWGDQSMNETPSPAALPSTSSSAPTPAVPNGNATPNTMAPATNTMAPNPANPTAPNAATPNPSAPPTQTTHPGAGNGGNPASSASGNNGQTQANPPINANQSAPANQ